MKTNLHMPNLHNRPGRTHSYPGPPTRRVRVHLITSGNHNPPGGKPSHRSSSRATVQHRRLATNQRSQRREQRLSPDNHSAAIMAQLNSRFIKRTTKVTPQTRKKAQMFESHLILGRTHG